MVESVASPRPDLSHLLAAEHGRAYLTRLVLAEAVWGAQWVALAGSSWRLMSEGRVVASISPAYGVDLTTWLPDPERDPVATSDLMVREGVHAVPIVGADGRTYYYGCRLRVDTWRKGYVLASGEAVPVMWETPGRAVVAIALDLHAGGPLADLIRPLLEVR